MTESEGDRLERLREQQERRAELELECERAKVVTAEDDYTTDAWDELNDGPQIWLDGVPEYVRRELGVDRSGWDDTHVYRTAFVCEMFGEQETPPLWTRVAHYTTSGEAECRCCDEERVTEENERGALPDCVLCEGDGLIYLGDGYREVIYKAPKGIFWPEDHCIDCGHDLEKFYLFEGTYVSANVGKLPHVLCMNVECMQRRLEHAATFNLAELDETLDERLRRDIWAALTPRKID